jgi:hypothetical protein
MKKFISIFAVVLVIALAVSIWFVFFATYSSGYRVGRVIKMTKRGVVFKTFEGQLHTGGISADVHGDATSMWDFSVRKDNKEILEQIEDAVDSGNRVKLYYDEKFYQWPFFGDTKYFITRVEKLKADSSVDEK